MVDTHVRTADAGSGHFYKNIVFFVNNRLFNVDYSQVFRLYDLYSFH